MEEGDNGFVSRLVTGLAFGIWYPCYYFWQEQQLLIVPSLFFFLANLPSMQRGRGKKHRLCLAMLGKPEPLCLTLMYLFPFDNFILHGYQPKNKEKTLRQHKLKVDQHFFSRGVQQNFPLL